MMADGTDGVALEDVRALVGRRFPGGTFRIEHWENVLLTEAMASDPLPGDLAHPAFLFHAPLAGAGITIPEIFELCRAESDEAVRAGEYRWELHRPLREGRTYRMSGGFTDVVRKQGRRAGVMDVVTFRIDVHDAEDGEHVAAAENSWIFLRS